MRPIALPRSTSSAKASASAAARGQRVLLGGQPPQELVRGEPVLELGELVLRGALLQ